MVAGFGAAVAAIGDCPLVIDGRRAKTARGPVTYRFRETNGVRVVTRAFFYVARGKRSLLK